MFSGISKPTFDRLSHVSQHLQSFGMVRGQEFDAQKFVGNEAEIEDLSVETMIINDGSDGLVVTSLPGQTAGDGSVLVGTGQGEGENAVSVGIGNTVSEDGDYSVVIGYGSSANNLHSVAIGRGITTRNDNEFALRGLRIIRLTQVTTTDTPTAITVFTLEADGESALVEGAVTAYEGTQVAGFKYDYALLNRAGGAAIVTQGSNTSNDPDGKGYTATIGASGTSLIATVTGGAGETVVWTLVFRIWCSPL